MGFGDWIRSSNKLPPTPEYLSRKSYLATTKDGTVVSVDYVTTKIRGTEVTRWEWHGRICLWVIIAWMAYPDPYIENREAKDNEIIYKEHEEVK